MHYRSHAMSPETKRSYAAQCRLWEGHCARAGVAAWPATADGLMAWLRQRADQGQTPATLRLALAAVVSRQKGLGHDSPVNDRVIEEMRGIARVRGGAQSQAAPLDEPALLAIEGFLAARGGMRATADRAIVRVMSDAGLRRSEAAALSWGDVEFVGDHALLTVKRSKTDQLGDGAVVAVTPQGAAALRDIRPAGVSPEDSVFGLCARQISRRIAAAAAAAGVPGAFSGHSGRVGLAQRMAANGAPDALIMRQGRWRDARSVGNYIRRQRAAEALAWL